MSGYSQGVRVEHLVVHHLTEQGFECQRAASSKGVCDVIGFRTGLVALVNVKRTTMPGPAERIALLRVTACLPSVALPLVALKPSRKPLEFRLLTGPGPKDWQAWEPEHDQGDDDPRPCQGRNTNVCVAEGCFNEACRDLPARDPWSA